LSVTRDPELIEVDVTRTFERVPSENARNQPATKTGRIGRPRIVVVDDDLDILELISFHLAEAGYEVGLAVNGAEARFKIQTLSPDLVILDLMLPDIDGFTICKELRSVEQTREIPVVLVSARTREADRVYGFELGANDFVPKPFSPRELVLRIRNLLQADPNLAAKEDLLYIGDLCIDLAGHSVTLSGERVPLTLTEYRLLTVLAQHNGRVQSREHLLAEVWNGETPLDPRTVDTHMARLREKLGKASRLVDTVYGVGYRFVQAQ
jgi:two-component system, OmpR family, phosphate regulon response regulator PhoB